MVIAFANNQVIVSSDGATSIIYTDPVPLGDADRATANLMVDYIYNTTAPGFVYQGQVSNDGTNWIDVTGLTDGVTAAITSPAQKVAAVHGAFIRFKYSFKAATSVVGAVSFDLHVLLDHA